MTKTCPISKSTAATMWLWVTEKLARQERCRKQHDHDGDVYPPNLLRGMASLQQMQREIEAYQKQRGWRE